MRFLNKHFCTLCVSWDNRWQLDPSAAAYQTVCKMWNNLPDSVLNVEQPPR